MTRKRLVPILSTALAALAVPALAQTVVQPDATPPAPRQESALTRDLNSGPPVPVRTPPPVEAPAPAPEPVSVPVAAPAADGPAASGPAVVAAPPASSLADDLNSGPPARVAPPAASTPPSRPMAVPPPTRAPAPVSTPVSVPASAPVSAPVVRAEPAPVEPTLAPPVAATPAPVEAPVEAVAPPAVPPAVAPAAPPSPAALGPAEIAALPFRIDLPPGFRIVPRPAGPDAQVYSVRRGDLGFVTVYAGPAAQFPIYDGQMVQSGGRASVIVVEDGRRHALEHLFQRAVAPHEIHIWVSSLEGGDRDLAERIAQTIEAR